MKKASTRVVERLHPVDFYHPGASFDFVIQKKGLFGWKTLIEVYDGNWSSHYRWSYFFKPGRGNCYDTFNSIEECTLFLETYYNERKPTFEVVETLE